MRRGFLPENPTRLYNAINGVPFTGIATADFAGVERAVAVEGSGGTAGGFEFDEAHLAEVEDNSGEENNWDYIAISPDGQWMAVITDRYTSAKRFLLYKLVDDVWTRQPDLSNIASVRGLIEVKFSRDSKWMAIGKSYDSTAPTDDKVMHMFELVDEVWVERALSLTGVTACRMFAFSPTEDCVITAQTTGASIHRLAEYKLENGNWTGPTVIYGGNATYGYTGLEFMSDGQMLIAVYRTGPVGEVHVYKKNANQWQKTTALNIPVSMAGKCAVSNDGRWLCFTKTNATEEPVICEIKDGQCILHEEHDEFDFYTHYGCAFSADSKYMAISDTTARKVRLYELTENDYWKISTMTVQKNKTPGWVTFSQDGKWLAISEHTGFTFNPVYKWSAGSGMVQNLINPYTTIEDAIATPGFVGLGFTRGPIAEGDEDTMDVLFD